MMLRMVLFNQKPKPGKCGNPPRHQISAAENIGYQTAREIFLSAHETEKIPGVRMFHFPVPPETRFQKFRLRPLPAAGAAEETEREQFFLRWGFHYSILPSFLS